MIKFFRKVRKKLISEGNPSQYLKYAIGEIALVVIGILIALQVNNWNERNKLINQEEEILLLLDEELHDNLRVFDFANAENKVTTSKVDNYLNNPDVYSHPDSLQNLSILFNYYPAEINQSILNKILDGTNEKLVMGKDLLKRLRTLKRSFTATNKTLFYLDEFWNTNTSRLLISSNLGDNMGGQQDKFEVAYNPDKEFKTTLIMQQTFILSYVRQIDQNIKESKEAIKQIENVLLRN